MFSRIATKRIAQSVRRMSTFREKSAREIWLSDAGAYPIMGIIAVAGTGATVVGIRFLLQDPDARLTKEGRSAKFRGEMYYEK